jgi:hypothetical protein
LEENKLKEPLIDKEKFEKEKNLFGETKVNKFLIDINDELEFNDVIKKVLENNIRDTIIILESIKKVLNIALNDGSVNVGKNGRNYTKYRNIMTDLADDKLYAGIHIELKKYICSSGKNLPKYNREETNIFKIKLNESITEVQRITHYFQCIVYLFNNPKIQIKINN